MPIEYLSVVNKNDQVIAELPRNEIHAKGLCHRAVHVLVFNQQDELFLQKRSMKKDLNKGLWDTSAAGHVDAGEAYRDAAIRETQEELGIDIKDTCQFLFKLSPTPQLGMEFIEVYRCLNNGPFSLNSDEIDEGLWVSNESISERISVNDPLLTETFKTIWRNHQQSVDIR